MIYDDILDDLKNIAELLAVEIREGKWKGKYIPILPVPKSKILVKEIQKRCPGYSKTMYKSAIAYGLFTTR